MTEARRPAVAGYFYPADPEALRHDVEGYLSGAAQVVEALGIVVPHAGYVYSGRIAGMVYGAIRPPAYCVLLGPNHTGRGARLALAPQRDWVTPLGTVAIDAALTTGLARSCSLLTLDPAAHRDEHAIEVQLPFLQQISPEVRFAAICVGTTDPAPLAELGHALARVVRATAGRLLLVVSSDMNHYESAAAAAVKDRLAIERIVALDPEGLDRVVRDQGVSMCGFAPAMAVLTACRDLGAAGGRLLGYGHSGEVSGDNESVVGYAGLALA